MKSFFSLTPLLSVLLTASLIIGIRAGLDLREARAHEDDLQQEIYRAYLTISRKNSELRARDWENSKEVSYSGVLHAEVRSLTEQLQDARHPTPADPASAFQSVQKMSAIK